MDLSAHFNTTLILSAYEPATWYTSTIQTGNPLANSPEGGVFTFSGNSYSIKSICQQSQNFNVMCHFYLEKYGLQ